MKAFLLLEDGTVYEGVHIGAKKEVVSEIVFNTSMVGYVEVLTDPSYAGQAVCMTYPLIGNYGISNDDVKDKKPWVSAMIVRELSRIPSNFRCDMKIQDYLEQHGVTGIAGIDTRALTKHLRDKGTMKGMITTNPEYSIEETVARITSYVLENAVSAVTCKESYTIAGVSSLEDNGPLAGSAKFVPEDFAAGIREKNPSMVKTLNGLGKHVAVLDYGLRSNVVEFLQQRGCKVTVYPANTKTETILKENYDGVLLSDGPGNPKEYTDIIEEMKKLYQASIPIFGMGLGHQLMALAVGADTYRLKYGHRGANQPVKAIDTGKVYVTGQNHGYAVDVKDLDAKVATETFINVNDGSNEGLRYYGKSIFTVQFQPESCGNLFDYFMNMMEEKKDA